MVLFFNKHNKKKLTNKSKPIKVVFEQAKKSSDFHQYSPFDDSDRLLISYYKSMVDVEKVNRLLLPSIQKHIGKTTNLDDIKNYIPFDDLHIVKDGSDVQNKLMQGYAMIQLNELYTQFLAVNIENNGLGIRKNNDTENEFTVVGPKVGFIENMDVNIHLLRNKISISDLVIEEVIIGSMSKTKVAIAYLDGITNPQNIQTVRQRLKDIDLDVVFDNSHIDQILSDNSNTIFPTFLSTERIDKAVFSLVQGQIAVLSNGSPYVITGPATLMNFFITPEDYYFPWIIGSFFRVIRYFSVIFSIFATPLYVAILTFHYEVIPEVLLGPLINSRANVPFPPVLEVIFMELTIELLREAGARLPTKVGQTLGIVGGIVIGQATVEAALTSNILLIIVALSALASFTTPNYTMSNAIRVLRFPFIVTAALWGGLGIAIGMVFLFGHLLRLKSFGTPYLVPLFPFRRKNFRDSFIRSSFDYTTARSKFLRPLKIRRYTPKRDREDINNE
ncbi:spore germination protein [Virgibacillus oceani]|uniref:Spore germination protein n=1 Tax=Virgibacillus oceani TaxID=1479511 RepID=A0A917HFN6_9BACI|nr:spore germination protein [Virgibacillus oceani]GGG77455.1 spore germination protein [Virgibacillus oceani]